MIRFLHDGVTALLSASGVEYIINMREFQDSIAQIGNSRGAVMPKPVLAQVDRRKGWAEASRKIAEASDHWLVMGEFTNESEAELVW